MPRRFVSYSNLEILNRFRISLTKLPVRFVREASNAPTISNIELTDGAGRADHAGGISVWQEICFYVPIHQPRARFHNLALVMVSR